MARIENRNLSIILLGGALVCAGAILTVSGNEAAGVPVSLVGTLIMCISSVLATLKSRSERSRR